MSTTATDSSIYSTAAVALRLNVEEWKVHKAFRAGWVRERGRVGRARAIPAADVALVERALREHGFITDPNTPG